MDRHFVYWIHLPEHTDPHTEGYVGVSIRPEQRMKEHASHKEFWDDRVTWEILHEFGTSEESYDKEEEYRPEGYIGWNIKKGGGGLNQERTITGKRSLSASYLELLNEIEKLEKENLHLKSIIAGSTMH